MVNILLVEDDKFLRDLLSKKLSDNNHSVSEAFDGEEAIKKVNAEKPDIVLLDIVLPGMDGFEVLKEIKSAEASANTPVMILSNLGQKEDMEKALRLGAADYLVKAKFDMEDILGRMNATLEANDVQAPTKKKKILIIEDEQVLLDVLLKKLTKENYFVSFAMDGEEGMEKIKSEKPDLILLDIVMPKKNGYEVLQEMQNDETMKNIPVVVISNSGQMVEIEKILALGVKDYLVKAEFSPEDVLEKVKKYLSN